MPFDAANPSRLELMAGASAPFLHIRSRAGEPIVQGTSSLCLGHRFKLGDGRDDGYFLEWSWDGSTVRVRSHPYGYAPVFYFATPREFCISTSIPELLRHGVPAELDYVALAVFARVGFFVGEDTPFKHVRAISRTGIVVWRRGAEASIEGRALDPSALQISREEALREYGRLFAQSITRRLPGRPFTLPLTGGRDSRHILFELRRQGRDPQGCITAQMFPPHADDDARVAQMVCGDLRLAHTIVQQPRWRLKNDSLKNTVTSYRSDEHTWAVPFLSALAGRTSVLFSGIGGDVLSAGTNTDPETFAAYVAHDWDRVAESILTRWGHGETALRFELGPRWNALLDREAAVHRLVEAIKSFAHAHNPLTSFYFWTRTRNEIGLFAFSMCAEWTDPVAPYLDADLLPFLLSLPASMILDRKFHTDLILQLYPQWSHIPFQDASVQRWNAQYARRAALELLWFVMQRAGHGTIGTTGVGARLMAGVCTGNPSRMWFDPYRLHCLAQVYELHERYSSGRRTL